MAPDAHALELETEEAKELLKSIVWYYSKIPAEYVSLAGLKKIYILPILKIT